MGRGPILKCQVLTDPRLFPQLLTEPGAYAVLATLSGRYPPLEGKLPTRYSPVCR